MAFKYRYQNQARLLTRVLPYVAEEPSFALKGGAAINLFVQNMPRLPVDIDLTFLPVEGDWDESSAEIEKALERIRGRIESFDDRMQMTLPNLKNSSANKLTLKSANNSQIKIESTPAFRGCVYPPELKTMVGKAEALFGASEINVMSFADLYAEKIVVTLDQQRPRDLYDVFHLLNNVSIDAPLRTALVVYLISYHRSVHDVLNPKPKDLAHEYNSDFVGIAEEFCPMSELEDVKGRLVEAVVEGMPEAHKKFLLSFYKRQPEWQLLDVEGIEHLPAVQWKGLNLDKASEAIRNNLVSELEKVFQ